MAIKVSCSCGQTFSAKDELEGQTLLCPKCHQPLTIGAPAAAVKPTGGGADDLFEDVGLKEVKGKRCPSCGEGMADVAVICVHCGFNIHTGEIMTSNVGPGQAKAGTTERILERAAEMIEDQKKEDKRVRAQGAPAWALFAALVIVIGFASCMYLLPKDQAFRITGWAFIILGGLVQLVCGIQLIIIAFKEDVVCGLLYLFLPFYSLYYWITRWAQCRTLVIRTFIAASVQLLGGGFIWLSPVFAPDPEAEGALRRPSPPRVVVVETSEPGSSHQRS